MMLPVIQIDLKGSGMKAYHGKVLQEEFRHRQTLCGYACPPGLVLVVWEADREKFHAEFDVPFWVAWNEGVGDLDLAVLMTLGNIFAGVLNRLKQEAVGTGHQVETEKEMQTC